jgi:FAD/FMN-containing dehydrogenase
LPAIHQLVKQLEKTIPSERVLERSEIPPRYRFDALRPYRPYPRLRKQGYLAAVLVRPETVDEVSDVVRVARLTHVPVVPYGGGTGLMGAAIPLRGGIIIDTSMMNRIEKISADDMFVRAQAGVVLEDLNTNLQSENLLFAHDPWTRPVATLGGAIGTNSLGYMGAKYGSIGNQLLGVEAVMPDGRTIRTRPAQFSSTGFDLRRLFLGTEAIFGIVTSATVRAFPEPKKLALASYEFGSFEQGLRMIVAMRAFGVRPIMIDYGEENPGPRGEVQLNLAYDGLVNEVEAHLRETDRLAREFKGKKLDAAEAQEFWDTRHDIAIMYSRRVSKRLPREEPRTKYDYIHVSLLASNVMRFREEALRIAKSNDVQVLEVGLWHGPELVSLVLSSTATNPKNATRKLWRTSNAIISYAQDLGGSMEFCHGVGLKLAHLMEREHGLGLEIMRRLKHAVDPLGIMNPGKQGL